MTIGVKAGDTFTRWHKLLEQVRQASAPATATYDVSNARPCPSPADCRDCHERREAARISPAEHQSEQHRPEQVPAADPDAGDAFRKDDARITENLISGGLRERLHCSLSGNVR
jgi:hypothetical protein